MSLLKKKELSLKVNLIIEISNLQSEAFVPFWIQSGVFDGCCPDKLCWKGCIETIALLPSTVANAIVAAVIDCAATIAATTHLTWWRWRFFFLETQPKVVVFFYSFQLDRINERFAPVCATQ